MRPTFHDDCNRKAEVKRLSDRSCGLTIGGILPAKTAVWTETVRREMQAPQNLKGTLPARAASRRD
jgi:hypothetical protein